MLVGLLGVLAVAGGHWFGLDRRLELMALDERFRHASFAPPCDEIVHIDIDDGSLEKLGRWPWPRATLAGILDVLSECGAETVALDIILPEPEKTRFVSDKWDIYALDNSPLTGTDIPLPVFDDILLADAIRRGGHVVVPIHVDLHSQPSAKAAAMLDAMLTRDPAISADKALAELQAAAPAEAAAFSREAFTTQYLRARSLSALKSAGIPPTAIGDYPAIEGMVIPPLATFTAGIEGTGFVTVETDFDGVVRRIPLLTRCGGQIYPQLALTLAAKHLAKRHGGSYRIEGDGRSVTIRLADGTNWGIPVEKEGRAAGAMQINWIVRPSEDAPPRHLPASAIWYVCEARQKIRKNDAYARHLALELADLAKAGGGELENQYYKLAQLVQQADEAYLTGQDQKRRILQATLFDSQAAKLQSLRQQLSETESLEARTEQQVQTVTSEIASAVLAQLAGRKDKLDDGDKRMGEICALINRTLPEANAQLRDDASREVRRLGQMIRGKVCLLGSTATGAADFVPTPIHGRAPGVVVHGNIFNTIVSRAFVTPAAWWMNVATIVLAGALVCLIAGTRPLVTQAGPAMLLLMGAYAAFNALVVFRRWHVQLALVAPAAAMLAGYLLVAVYRQLTEERAKRQIRGMFAHALSPALVDRLIDDPSMARLGGEKRELTCFFSDLAGFTSIAERLGEQRTVQLLNRYFDRVTDIIQNRCGGYLNKFLGDGIFAFFGAPVPQADHRRQALAAAVHCQNEVNELNESLADTIQDFTPLSVRIGITTGQVMVGNCGSTHRMDYTAIGDSVNLASRLESANKFFGTRILAGEETLERKGDDEFLARPLGRVQVVGKNEPVVVWNLIGPIEQALPNQVRAFADFAHALGLFQNHEFAAAAEAFEQVLALLPADRPAAIYRDLCRQYAAFQPPDNWQGEIRLTEK